MEAEPLIVRPPLFGMAELFRRLLIVWQVNSILWLIQVHVGAPGQQQKDEDRADNSPLNITPFEASILSFITTLVGGISGGSSNYCHLYSGGS